MKTRRGGAGRIRGARDKRSYRITVNIDAETKAALERDAAAQSPASTVSRAAAATLRRALLGRKGGSSHD